MFMTRARARKKPWRVASRAERVSEFRMLASELLGVFFFLRLSAALRLRLFRGAGFGLPLLLAAAAAEPLCCCANTAADALALRLPALLRRLGVAFRARVELAADELHLRDLGAVAFA